MTKKLYRSCEDKMLGGVAGGVAEYFDVDSTLVRLVMILLIFSGIGPLIYIMAWIVIPQNPKCKNKQTPVEEIKEKAKQIADEVKDVSGSKDKKDGEARLWLGAGVLILGSMLLAQNITGIDIWHNFWPLLLIFFGVILLITRK